MERVTLGTEWVGHRVNDVNVVQLSVLPTDIGPECPLWGDWQGGGTKRTMVWTCAHGAGRGITDTRASSQAAALTDGETEAYQVRAGWAGRERSQHPTSQCPGPLTLLANSLAASQLDSGLFRLRFTLMTPGLETGRSPWHGRGWIPQENIWNTSCGCGFFTPASPTAGN